MNGQKKNIWEEREEEKKKALDLKGENVHTKIYLKHCGSFSYRFLLWAKVDPLMFLLASCLIIPLKAAHFKGLETTSKISTHVFVGILSNYPFKNSIFQRFGDKFKNAL